MTYTDHLRSIIIALIEARPGLSYARISSETEGVGRNWVSDFMSRRAGTLGNAELVIETCRRLCPEDQSGDRVRQLLAIYEQSIEDQERGAA